MTSSQGCSERQMSLSMGRVLVTSEGVTAQAGRYYNDSRSLWIRASRKDSLGSLNFPEANPGNDIYTQRSELRAVKFLAQGGHTADVQ